MKRKLFGLRLFLVIGFLLQLTFGLNYNPVQADTSVPSRKVDAAVNWGNGKAYFFSGSSYYRFDIATAKTDPGYPKEINLWPGLWPSGIDAAINWGNGKVYFFKGSQYLRYDIAGDRADPGFPKDIAANWPGIWGNGIDAAVRWDNGKAYFFKGNQYIRYDLAADRVDSGYPMAINNSTWPGIWADGIDDVVNWGNGKVYFFKRDQYIQYDVAAERADPGYPKPINAMTWPGLLLSGSNAPTVVSTSALTGAILFADDFRRPDGNNPGPQWEEYLVRADNGSVPRRGDSPWSIRGNSLYYSATGNNAYIEDFIQTAQSFPADRIKVEFDIRATAGTRQGYVGPLCFLAPPAVYRRGASNLTSDTSGQIMGVAASYRWENGGTRGLLVFNNGSFQDFPNAVFSGVNEPGFAHHEFIIRDGVIVYSAPQFQSFTLKLQNALQPGARRHLAFGARLYDAGVMQTVEIRNVKITSLDETAPGNAVAKPNPANPNALAKPESYYCDIAEGFLKGVVAGDTTAIARYSGAEFQKSITFFDLIEFRQQLQEFQYTSISARSLTVENNAAVSVMIVLANQKGRQVNFVFLIRRELIEQCVARWGVQ